MAEILESIGGETSETPAFRPGRGHVARIRGTLDMLLRNDVPFESVFDRMCAPAQKHIQSHPAYVRAKLSEVAKNSAPSITAHPKM